jgi:uncharacterized protein (TIGR03435 family)
MKKAALSILMATLMLAQTPDSGKKVEFEVASIRVAKQDGNHDSDSDKGQFTTHNLTLKRLIAMAYDVDFNAILGGPAWVDSESYDINAKIPAEFAQQTRVMIPLMIQSLLGDRFQLAIHREPRQVAGYALVVAKKGPKLEHAKGDEKDSSTHSTGAHLTAQNVTMEALAKRLSRMPDIGSVVVDKTGLSGGFDFELDWMPGLLKPGADSAADDDRPSIFSALQGQLGLRLESGKVPIQAIVIDRAERPSGN